MRRLGREDMAAAAVVHRTAFDARLPWLTGIHTPDEDRTFWQETVFGACEIWGVERDRQLLGVIAFRQGWIDQLYVLPAFQGQGIGMRLLERAKSTQGLLSLWTFQRNAGARRFYEAQGFRASRETDGRNSEEREPDILYRWARSGTEA